MSDDPTLLSRRDALKCLAYGGAGTLFALSGGMDDEPHTVVSDTGVFKSGGMDTNETFSHKFDKAGTYHFTCSIHPRMTGTIIVQ